MTASAINSLTSDWLLKNEFENFKTKFSVKYETPEEEAYRFQIFKSTIERVVSMNKEHNTSVFGITKFSDLTEEEFRLRYLTGKPKTVDAPVYEPGPIEASSFDWRSHGVVTSVKDQGQCGSCWAHSAVETVESAWAIAGNKLTKFSVQQVNSCDSDDYGCSGGWPSSAFEYIESAGGLATEATYPYSDSDGDTSSCKSKITIAGGQVTGWSYATPQCKAGSCSNQNEQTLIASLAKQPISIVVDASKWSYYSSGVYPTSACSSSRSSLDHAVQLVGYTNYGSSSGYYIVRNSWSTDWGVDGYIYLPIGSNACGIADIATIVSVA
jgi:C1A family cysteine protease